jgi:lycopene cyclase domain-containing protein
MFERYSYLLSLLVALGCLVLIDHRWRLVLFAHFKAAWQTLICGMVFFVGWDIGGIALNIFYSGRSRFMSGLYVGSNFPVEELFFLLILNYTPLLLWEGLTRRHV